MTQKGILGFAVLMLAGLLVYGLTKNVPLSPVATMDELPYGLIEAQDQARLEDKLIVIDFYATWCGPCKSFTRDSKRDREMKSALDDVVLYKVNCETGDGPELARKFGVKSYPTFLVMEADGTVVDRWSGYAKRHFLGQLEKAM